MPGLQTKSLSVTETQALESGQWVQLKEVPSAFAQDEALLLCEISQNQWLTWVPNHGEYLLELSK
jgi:uncharacterized protein YqcC (DUF446 family)